METWQGRALNHKNDISRSVSVEDKAHKSNIAILLSEFADRVPPDDITRVYRQTLESFGEPTVRGYLPILVMREATIVLEKLAEALSGA